MAVGDIGDLIEYLNVSGVTKFGNRPDIIHVSGDVYAVAHQAGNIYGRVSTFTIDSEGVVGDSVIDTFDFDSGFDTPGTGMLPQLIHISGSVYAIPHTHYPAKGWITTITINDNGQIDDAALDTGIFEATYGTAPHMIHVYGNVYAVLYSYTSSRLGRLKTITIETNGTVGAVVDTFSFEAMSNYPSGNIIQISAGVFGFVYSNDSNIGKITTVSISQAGQIGDTPLDTDPFDTNVELAPYITHISGNVYAIAYEGEDDDGFLKTIIITPQGAIGDVQDTLEFDTTGATMSRRVSPKILHIVGHVYVIISISLTMVRLSTVNIYSDGAIGDTLIDTFSPATLYGFFPSIIHISGSIYAFIYYTGATPTYETSVRTISIDNVVPSTVSTDSATSVEATTATLKGTLEDDGGEACDVRFQYGETSGYGIDTEWQSGKESVVAFEQAITGLDPNKTYHFRGQARNSTGTVNGADRTFTTLVATPMVTTDPATELRAIAAILNGTLNQDGGEACDCGFEYGKTVAYGETTPTESKTTGEAFSQVIGGPPNTTYHFRAFATNSAGTSYGADRTFTTELVINRAYALARREL